MRAKVLEAVENSYRQTAHDLDHDEEHIQSWVSTVMLRLVTELENRELAKQKVLEALQQEFEQWVPSDNDAVEGENEPGAIPSRKRKRCRSSRQLI
jgi:hypothetical protein